MEDELTKVQDEYIIFLENQINVVEETASILMLQYRDKIRKLRKNKIQDFDNYGYHGARKDYDKTKD